MELELKFTEVTGCEPVGDLVTTQEESMETAIPEYCPDMARIVDTVGQLRLREKHLTGQQLTVSGSVVLTVLYTSEESAGLRSLSMEVPFSCQVEDKRLMGCTAVCVAGRLLLAAGGAVDEAYLLTAPELVRERTIHTQSPCFAAGFWRGGLLLVCAVEGEDIHTAVYTLAPGTPRPRKLIDLPGQPGGLCVCPDGVGALISTRDGLMKLDIPQGRLLWNLPDLALCAGLCCRGPMALVSATLGGQVRLLSHYKPWLSKTVFTGTDVHACFLMA